VVGNAGDAAKRVVLFRRRGVHLADDRMLGPFYTRQGLHRAAHARSTAVLAHWFEFARRVGEK